VGPANLHVGIGMQRLEFRIGQGSGIPAWRDLFGWLWQEENRRGRLSTLYAKVSN
jgi:hypothetical protein